MELSDELNDILERGGELFLPNLSIDIAIFGYEEGELKVLLLEIVPGKWMLPGGFIFREEFLEDAASRILKERSGLENLYLKQFYTFGRPDRSFSNEMKELFEQNNLPWTDDLWLNQRFVSTGYYSLVNIPETRPVAGMFARSIAWYPVNQLPNLLMDHREIILKARDEFKKDLQVSPVAFHLLPQKFTMPELHSVFESVFEKKMDRSRFQKKMFEYDIFQRLEERREGVAHRRPYLYKFKG